MSLSVTNSTVKSNYNDQYSGFSNVTGGPMTTPKLYNFSNPIYATDAYVITALNSSANDDFDTATAGDNVFSVGIYTMETSNYISLYGTALGNETKLYVAVEAGAPPGNASPTMNISRINSTDEDNNTIRDLQIFGDGFMGNATFKMWWETFKNETVNQTARFKIVNNKTLTYLDIIQQNGTHFGDNWTVRIFVDNGTTNSTAFNSSIYISNSILIVPNVTAINLSFCPVAQINISTAIDCGHTISESVGASNNKAIHMDFNTTTLGANKNAVSAFLWVKVRSSNASPIQYLGVVNSTQKDNYTDQYGAYANITGTGIPSSTVELFNSSTPVGVVDAYTKIKLNLNATNRIGNATIAGNVFSLGLNYTDFLSIDVYGTALGNETRLYVETTAGITDSCTYTSGTWTIIDPCTLSTTVNTCPHGVNITSNGILNISSIGVLNVSKIYISPPNSTIFTRLFTTIGSKLYIGQQSCKSQ